VRCCSRIVPDRGGYGANAGAGNPIRLCKGAYKEGPTVAFPEKTDVDANYVKLMKRM